MPRFPPVVSASVNVSTMNFETSISRAASSSEGRSSELMVRMSWNPLPSADRSARHFFASTALHEGETIKAVSEYLGHADPGFTLRPTRI